MVSASLFLLLAYGISSLWEHWFHRAVLHAGARPRRAWRRWPGLGPLLRLAHFFHHTVHHRRTFGRSALIQFESPAQRAALDARLNRIPGSRWRDDRYGASLAGPWQYLTVAAAPILLNLGVALVLCPALWWAGTALALLPLFISKFIHPLLHDLAPTGLWWPHLARPLQKSTFFRLLRRYHHIHHVHGSVNFNLVLGADFLMSSQRLRGGPAKNPSVAG